MSDDAALQEFVKQMIANDQCPKCLGELDTGWECNNCGFDAKALVESEATT